MARARGFKWDNVQKKQFVVDSNGVETTLLDETGSGGGGGTSASIETSTTSPSNPIDGDLWFDTTDGTMYVYYDDGTSSQWVGISGATGATGPAGSGGGSGGGVTSYADITARNAATVSEGDMAWVTSDTSLYVYDGNEWDRIYSGENTTPNWTTEPDLIYSLEEDGTNTIITTVAVDPEGFPIEYDYDTNPTNPSQITSIVNNNDGTFTMTPSTTTSDAGSFALRIKASDGISILSKTVEVNLSFVPQQAANIGFFDFSNSASYPGTGNTFTNIALGTPASVSETINPGGGSYLSAGTTGNKVFKFVPTSRTSINFSSPMETQTKTVVVIFSALTGFKNIMFGGVHNTGDYNTVFYNSSGVIQQDTNGWPGETPAIRVNGTIVTNSQAAYNALDLTGNKFNSLMITGYNFLPNVGMDYNAYLAGDWSTEHEVLGFMMWDTVLTSSELQKAHTVMSGTSLTAPWAG